ncbi:MAG: hypothetical protein CVV48_05725 [Spirochaetae bacterium HGW-Spirochaetae-4]|nr:MAG: hypothetical protein CVV48_05725 [Spirochaetae bacterium HGW-Spirochaetae-4]
MPMRIALLSDIHGNIAALESVLADCAYNGVDSYVFLGDLVFFGLHPQECFEAVVSLAPIACIKGNTDANLEEVDTFRPSSDFERELFDCIVDCDRRLSNEAKRTIAGWPIVHPIISGVSEIIYCHGSPYSFTDKLLPEGNTEERLAKLIAGERATLVCCGHTHIPGEFHIGHKRVVNAGSIGYSFDGDRRPSYAILDIEEDQISCIMRRVDYDWNGYRKELSGVATDLPLFSSIEYAVGEGRPKPR